jgi:hypothetical protein
MEKAQPARRKSRAPKAEPSARLIEEKKPEIFAFSKTTIIDRANSAGDKNGAQARPRKCTRPDP